MKKAQFSFEKLSSKEMNPIVGGTMLYSASTTGKNQTTSSGSDNDSKNGDQDADVVDSFRPIRPGGWQNDLDTNINW